MKSMTGFGCISKAGKDFQLEISIKSVNSRFIDTKFYTSFHYVKLETELQKIILDNCKRGFFVVRIDRYPQKPSPKISLNWDKNQALKWKNLYQKLSKELKIKNELTVENLAKCSGIVNVIEKPENLSRQEKIMVKKTFQKVFATCLKERKREGLALKKDILSNLRVIQSLLQKIKILNNTQKINYIKRKNKSLKEKQSKDLALEMEKFDIHEEIVRMTEHLKHFKKIASSSNSIGRKMDFYVQEILREMNTIGSKSQSSNLTLQVIEGKFSIEKIKEQIQNVE